MLAMFEAVDGDWAMMFFWLVVAFAVDGVDGPLARKFHVKKNAPEVDGVLLDLIIDYLTYVFIPAYALFQSDLVPGLAGWATLIAILIGSGIYFADTRMKTRDNSFAGFPGCWNMVVLVLFATTPAPWVCTVVVAALTAAMFTTLKFIHPVRTERWRKLSLPMAMLWTLCAGWAAWRNFEPPEIVAILLVVSSLYLMGAGIAQQLLPRRQEA